MRRDGRASLLSLLVVAGLLLPAAGAQAGVVVDTVARTGDAAPGAGPGVTFTTVGARGFTAGGHAYFQAGLQGPGVTPDDDSGIWGPDASGDLTLKLREGDPAPGTGSGITFASFESFVVNDDGQLSLLGFIRGPGVLADNKVVYGPQLGALTLLARTQHAAPGTSPGVVFKSLFSVRMNGSGRVVHGGQLEGTGVTSSNGTGFWLSDATGMSILLARQGDPAPGAPAGVQYGPLLSSGAPLLNDSGYLGFFALLQGAVNGSNDRGLFGLGYVGSSFETTLLIRAGDPAVGAPVGQTYWFSDGHPPPNALSPELAFSAKLNDPGLGIVSSGVWTALGTMSGTSTQLVVLEGSAAPGLAPGVTLLSPQSSFYNGLGQITVGAFLTGSGVDASNNQALWRFESGGGGALLAREGDPAPGVSAGVVLGGCFVSGLNGSGDVLLDCPLSGPGVGSGNDRALYLSTAPGSLSLLLREGDGISVAPGDTRVVSSYVSSSLGLSEAGTAMASVTFTDASQAVLVLESVDAAVPALGAAGWGLLSAALLVTSSLWLRSRRRV